MQIVNSQAFRQYQILEKFEAGIILTGPEVKSIKNERLDFRGSYIKFIDNELYLIGANIPLYKYSKNDNYDARRSRKLLLKKQELIRLQTKIRERRNLTIVPLKCYTKNGLLKLQIALSKGRKQHEIKSVEKERAIKRREKQAAKEYLKT